MGYLACHVSSHAVAYVSMPLCMSVKAAHPFPQDYLLPVSGFLQPNDGINFLRMLPVCLASDAVCDLYSWVTSQGCRPPGFNSLLCHRLSAWPWLVRKCFFHHVFLVSNQMTHFLKQKLLQLSLSFTVWHDGHSWSTEYLHLVCVVVYKLRVIIEWSRA